MAKVIDFKDSPVTKIKQKLKDKEEENKKVRLELKKAYNNIGKLVSVNEMLRLQLSDILANINFLKHHLNSFENNVNKLRTGLPDLSGYISQPVRIDTKSTSKKIDLNIVDKDKDKDKKD